MIRTLLCCGRLLDLRQPVVMGILNATPDSFFPANRVKNEEEALRLAEKMLREGAALLDIGGASSRPGAQAPDVEEELKRTIPLLQAIHRRFPEVILSIDTFRSRVVREAYHAGASLVNDISAGRWDPDLLTTVAELKMAYVLMHMQGEPRTMQINPHYEDVVQDVFHFFKEHLQQLYDRGITEVIVDPGFGFGKRIYHNYHLLKELEVYTAFGVPVLVGISRKSMIHHVLQLTAEEALNGSTVLHTIALLKGASILRVHDVREARQTILLVQQLYASDRPSA